MPLLWGVARNRTHTMGVYENYERERTTKQVWTDGTEGTDRIYEENRIISWNMNKDYVWKIKN
jgi:hypothetical protein